MELSRVLDYIAAPEDGSETLDDDDVAPVPPAQFGADLERMDAAIKELSKAALSVEDVPMHPSQAAAGLDGMDKATGGPPNFEKMDSPSLQGTRRRVRRQQEEILQKATAPPPLATVRGRSPSDPGGQRVIPVRPPPQSMMPTPDEDSSAPTVQVQSLPSDVSASTPMLEATIVAEAPVYDAVQVEEQSRLEKNKKLIIGVGVGLIIGLAVAAGVSVGSLNNPSSSPPVASPPGEVVPSSLRPSLSPTPPPSTYWATFDWGLTGAGFDGEAPGDFLGEAVAFSADATTVAVGAPGPWGNDDRPGYVKVYHRKGDKSAWKQRGDTLRGEANGDNFGHSLALSEDGTTLSVGAPRHDSAGSDAGQVKLYKWDEAVSNHVQMGDALFGAAAGDYFGRSMALSNGNVLAIGAPASDANGSRLGRVAVYVWDDSFSTFQQRRVAIDGDAADDFFGAAVSLSNKGKPSGDWFRTSLSLSGDGRMLVVGSPWKGPNIPTPGQVMVFAWDAASASYVPAGDFLRGDADGDYFGWSVSLSSDGATLAVGAPLNGDGGRRSGHAQVFGWDEAAGSFRPLGRSLPGAAGEGRFGSSVALSSAKRTLAVGAPRLGTGEPGYANVYGWDEASSEFRPLSRSLVGGTPSDGFGMVLALAGYGRVLAVGAPQNDKNGTNLGRVEVFNVESTLFY